jgi:hypothetical protein
VGTACWGCIERSTRLTLASFSRLRSSSFFDALLVDRATSALESGSSGVERHGIKFISESIPHKNRKINFAVSFKHFYNILYISLIIIIYPNFLFYVISELILCNFGMVGLKNLISLRMNGKNMIYLSMLAVSFQDKIISLLRC